MKRINCIRHLLRVNILYKIFLMQFYFQSPRHKRTRFTIIVPIVLYSHLIIYTLVHPFARTTLFYPCFTIIYLLSVIYLITH